MILGTLCDASLFHHQMKAFQDFAQCTVADHSSAVDLKKLAENILKSVAGDFSVMGLSYGGIIAFELWRQAPHRLKRIILLNTTHKPPSEATRALQHKLVDMACQGKFREITSDILKDAMLHPDHATNQSLRQLILQMAMNTGREKFINQVKSQLGRPDSTPDLPNIKCPVLIITGREDKICTPQIHAAMAALIPNSTLSIVEHCGHLSTLEQPQKVAERIEQWWASADKNKEQRNRRYNAEK
jgi:pimeloyl-ACP methyl ester carboxylesterase